MVTMGERELRSLESGGTRRRIARYSIKVLAIAVLFAWLMPFLSIASPSAVFSRDSVLALLACVSRIPDARSIVRREREVATVERQAFARFAERVENVETTTAPTAAQPTASALAVQSPESDGMRAVREAYRGTVMAMPHYEEEYGEDLWTDMAIEFGSDTATAVAENDTLTPQLKTALVEASRRAHQKRASFIRTLKTEYAALAEAEDTLTAVDEKTTRIAQTADSHRSLDDAARQSADANVSAYRHLETLEDDCERELRTRQNRLDRDDGPTESNLQEYLYASRSWTYPVLNDTLDCLRRVRAEKRGVVRAVLRLP